jgi:hypothetical protein
MATAAVWRQFQTPNPGGPAITRYLGDVSATSTKSVWAVGTLNGGAPAAAHWNGSSWVKKPLPPPQDDRGSVVSVTALTSTDVWAFGLQGVVCPARCPLWALHHTATGWHTSHVADLPSNLRTLVGVHAYSDTSFWAVGTGTSGRPAAANWDGHTWTEYEVPPAAPGDPGAGQLLDIARVPGTGKWFAAGKDSDTGRTLFAKWTPTAGFTRMDNTTPQQFFGGITDSLVVFSKQNAWAAGVHQDAAGKPKPLIQHWDGTSWRLVSTPQVPHAEAAFFNDLASGAKNRLVAVGVLHKASGVDRTLAERYNGVSWQITPTVNPSADSQSVDHLYAVTSVPGTHHLYWAVGDHGLFLGDRGTDHTLAERCVC